jgi:hypothetical protein
MNWFERHTNATILGMFVIIGLLFSILWLHTGTTYTAFLGILGIHWLAMLLDGSRVKNSLCPCPVRR